MDGDTISRQAAIDAIYKCTDIYVGNLPIMVDKSDAYKALAALPSAQSEKHTDERMETHACDLISRQAAIDAVKKNTFRLTFAEEQNCEGHVAWSANAVYSDVIEGALLELPSAQHEKRTEERTETHACDCISRQAAIDAIRASTSKYTGFMEMEMYTDDDAVEAIEGLPSAQPKTEEQTAKSAQNVPNDDLISRKAAIDALDCINGVEEVLRALSSAQPKKHTDERTETHACDLISRRAVIDVIAKRIPSPSRLFAEGVYLTEEELFKAQDPYVDCIEAVEALPSAQPEQQHGRVFKGIVVEYPSYNTYPEYKGKPYFSIKYTENGQGFIGYGTYNPEVLSEYLKEYFMPSAQPERKPGRWIPQNHNKVNGMTSTAVYYYPKCSVCGCCANYTNFCPGCGADMRGEQDE